MPNQEKDRLILDTDNLAVNRSLPYVTSLNNYENIVNDYVGLKKLPTAPIVLHMEDIEHIWYLCASHKGALKPFRSYIPTLGVVIKQALIPLIISK